MKKFFFLSLLSFGFGHALVFAQYTAPNYYSGTTNWITGTGSYTSGCTTYYYDRRTGVSLYSTNNCTTTGGNWGHTYPSTNYYSNPSYNTGYNWYGNNSYNYNISYYPYNNYNSYAYTDPVYVYPYCTKCYNGVYPGSYTYYNNNYWNNNQKCYFYYDIYGYYRSTCGY
jgi:hypothetical protein